MAPGNKPPAGAARSGAGETEEPSLVDLLELVKAQGVELKAMREQKGQGIDAATAGDLRALVEAQGKELKRLRELQEQWKDQYDNDMANRTNLEVDVNAQQSRQASQEQEAQRLAALIPVRVHQAANMLHRKVARKLTGFMWDHVVTGMVQIYNAAQGKAKDADLQAIKDRVKEIVVLAPDKSGALPPGRKIPATTWPDIEKALDTMATQGRAAVPV